MNLYIKIEVLRSTKIFSSSKHIKQYPDNQIGRQDLPAAAGQPTSAFDYGSAGRPCQAESAGRCAAGPAARLTHPTAPSEGHNC